MGDITTLLNKIQPIVSAIDEENSDAKLEIVVTINVKLSIKRARNESSILTKLEAVGEMYDVTIGAVSFYE